jgi:hypothetical protein
VGPLQVINAQAGWKRQHSSLQKQVIGTTAGRPVACCPQQACHAEQLHSVGLCKQRRRPESLQHPGQPELLVTTIQGACHTPPKHPARHHFTPQRKPQQTHLGAHKVPTGAHKVPTDAHMRQCAGGLMHTWNVGRRL